MFLIGYLAFGAAFYSWLFLWAEAERGVPCRWSKWAGRVGLLFVAAVLLAMLTGCGGKDDSDTAEGRSGMTPRTDALTGCQYLTYRTVYGASITPRMDRDGKQVCK